VSAGDELTRRIAALVAEELAGRNGGASEVAAAAAPGRPSARVTAIDAGRVVTVADVLDAEAAGAALRLPAGAIVTHLAREEAERLGVALVENGHPVPGRSVRSGHSGPEADGSPKEQHGRQSGSDYCTHCGGCMEPAVYDRKGRAVAGSTGELIARLDRFTELVWRTEPQDVRRLRQLSRPPMGRIPGVFYACFNLFWLGEEVQTLRDKAKAGRIDVAALNDLLATLCTRHAIRLSKWHVVDVIELLGDVANFLEQHGARTHDEYRELCEQLMLAADRVQAWVDRMLPWHTLDDRLELVT
jgi:hypothetical protein